MNKDKYVFAQLVGSLDNFKFLRIVKKYGGDKYVKSYTCWDQLLTMMFGQLSNREPSGSYRCNGGSCRETLSSRKRGNGGFPAVWFPMQSAISQFIKARRIIPKNSAKWYA